MCVTAINDADIAIHELFKHFKFIFISAKWVGFA